MKIGFKKEDLGCPFQEEEYWVDLSRQFGGYEAGDLLIHATPFFSAPLALELGIRRDGLIVFRSWSFVKWRNNYFHLLLNDVKPTDAQRETVTGLLSGRIKWEGLKLCMGNTIIQACSIGPEEVLQEEKRLGEKIYLA